MVHMSDSSPAVRFDLTFLDFLRRKEKMYESTLLSNSISFLSFFFPW